MPAATNKMAAQDPPPPVAGTNQAPLSGADLYDWIALRRVSDGLVAIQNGLWLESGRRMPGYVTDTLTALAEQRLVTLAKPDPWGMARATLTGAGSIRYEQLSRQRKTALRVPPPQFGTPRARSDPKDLASAPLITLAEAENVGFVQQHSTPTGLRVSDPQFLTKTPAGRRSSNLAPQAAPDGQPDTSSTTGRSHVEQQRKSPHPDETSSPTATPTGFLPPVRTTPRGYRLDISLAASRGIVHELHHRHELGMTADAAVLRYHNWYYDAQILAANLAKIKHHFLVSPRDAQ